MNTLSHRSYTLPILVTFLCLILAGGLAYQTVRLSRLTKEYTAQTHALQDTLDTTKSSYDSLSVLYAELEQKYGVSEENGAELLSELSSEQQKNDDLENKVDDISGTVQKLDKLSKIDPQLLQKYSKVYFLNEHYTPDKVTPIDATFVKNDDGMFEYIEANVAPFLDDMLHAAQDDAVSLLVVSAYRSFDEQAGLKNTYKMQYGTGANTFSADQGYSEHQLGTTVDLSSTEIGADLTGFENTKAYTWLTKNAYRYGFILSYPKDNTYYVYEPWHWRFVGKKLARDLHNDDAHFYDLEQRKIDTYLISLFD